MSERLTSEVSLDAWRRNIRADVAVGYRLGMGVAILHSEGAAAALPWFDPAVGQAVREEARVCARIEALNALGRNDEAVRLHEATACDNPKYAVVGLRELAAVYRDSSIVPLAAVADLHRRAVKTAEAAGDSISALTVRLQLAAHLLTAGGATEEEAQTAADAMNAETTPLDVDALEAAAAFAFSALQRANLPAGLTVCRGALQRLGSIPDPYALSRLIQAALACAAAASTTDHGALVKDLAAAVLAPGFNDLDATQAVCRRAASSGEWATAAATAAKVLARRPASGGVALMLARALLYRREAAAAIDVLERCRAAGGAAGGDAVDLLTLLLVTLIISDRAGDAASMLTDAVAVGLDAASAAFYRGLILLAQNDLAAAAAAFDEARRGHSPPPIVVAAAGVAAGLRGDAATADRLHAAATPRNDFTELMRGLTLHVLGRNEEAKTALRAALAVTPCRVWFLSRHFPQQYGALATAFRSVGWDLDADQPLGERTSTVIM